MLGIVSHSLIPLRLALFFGILISALSFLVGFAYLCMKLLYWDQFSIGIAPMMLGLFFMFGALFAYLGLIGEYVGSIHRFVRNRPIVVEKERINFD
jgi:dolichol-phosphate mannosyltransferase